MVLHCKLIYYRQWNDIRRRPHNVMQKSPVNYRVSRAAQILVRAVVHQMM